MREREPFSHELVFPEDLQRGPTATANFARETFRIVSNFQSLLEPWDGK